MPLQPFEQVLIDGSRRALLEFGSCEHCSVVDWRDEVEMILEDVTRMLPAGYLVYRQLDEKTWELKCQGRVQTLAAPPEGANTEPLLQSINRALLPDYEMRIFTPTIGDGYSLLIRPAQWWSEFSAAHPARARKLFVTLDQRVAVTGAASSLERQPLFQRLADRWMRLRPWQRGVLGTCIVITSLAVIICLATLLVMSFT